MPDDSAAFAPARPALLALAAEVAAQLDLLDYPRNPWVVPPRGEGVLDVAIIGGGQTGLTTAFGLRRERVERVRIFDAAPEGGAGVWTTFARMRTLRTPKHVPGPDLGVPALTPRAYFTARDGAAAWDGLHKIGREDWQRYLDWYAATLALPVAHEHRLTRVEEADGLLTLHLTTPGGPTTVRARKLVLATGIDGMGAWSIPAPFDALPGDRVSHTAGPVDFAALAGKRVLVVGAGASAFDNLAAALEAGAATGTMLVRRRRMPRVNPFRWAEQAGFLGQFHAMPDALRRRFMRHIATLNQPPPQESWDRVALDPRFDLHMASPVTAVRVDGPEVVVATPRAEHRCDHVIVGTGTGTATDLRLRPELVGLAEHVLLWRDAYVPPAGEESETLGACPYLTPGFALREKVPGSAPALRHIHFANHGATLSMGLSTASLSGLRYGVNRLVDGVCRALWLDDAAWHLDSLIRFEEPELTRPIPAEEAVP